MLIMKFFKNNNKKNIIEIDVNNMLLCLTLIHSNISLLQKTEYILDAPTLLQKQLKITF